MGAVAGALATASLLAAQSPPTAPKPAPAFDYIVGPSDVLAVNVFNQGNLSNKYTVGADGTFTFPELGSIKAGGLTVRAVENDLRDRLGETLFKNPQVSVTVEQFRSQQVYVMGRVRNPQRVEFTGAMSLIDALTRAGSIDERAGSEALIIRQADGATPDATVIEQAGSLKSGSEKADSEKNGKSLLNSNVIRVDLEALSNGDTTQNVPLRSGDIVSVPAAATVFVVGHVARTGEVPIRPRMTVQQVLALAGGITDRGSDRRIQINRQVDANKKKIDAKLDDLVQGGDTVDVRPRLW
jgi:polysaccharide biosynthesis/export protein